jgi:hypothetical protein
MAKRLEQEDAGTVAATAVSFTSEVADLSAAASPVTTPARQRTLPPESYASLKQGGESGETL